MPNDGPIEEARKIIACLRKRGGTSWDGREAILELQENDYQWRQMEWIGWYFEFRGRTALIKDLGGTTGPQFGNTQFDYKLKHVWDLKAHPTNTSSRWMILNDKEAIESCIAVHGGVGFVVAIGTAAFDLSGTFKDWHDDLKGGTSAYEAERIRRRAPSRRRKVSFTIDHYTAFYWNSMAEINQGKGGGWIRTFQEGMRNADGSPRRAKYCVRVDRMPNPIQETQT